jgi:hypothetical protein
MQQADAPPGRTELVTSALLDVNGGCLASIGERISKAGQQTMMTLEPRRMLDTKHWCNQNMAQPAASDSIVVAADAKTKAMLRLPPRTYNARLRLL